LAAEKKKKKPIRYPTEDLDVQLADKEKKAGKKSDEKKDEKKPGEKKPEEKKKPEDVPKMPSANVVGGAK